MNVDDAISIGEDAAVVYPYIMLCERVNIIDNFGYHYRQREDSMLKRTVTMLCNSGDCGRFCV